MIDHGYGFMTRYAHLSKINVTRGQRVKRGDVIAAMGSTGYSTGPHLHYEVWRNGKVLNPMNFILNDQ
jgi:murein DD-endopeptidase MepM/ murein hydrolase activator NlpD